MGGHRRLPFSVRFQQTQYVDHMLKQCWASVEDGITALAQDKLGWYRWKSVMSELRVMWSHPADTRYWHNVGSLLAQRRRRWTNNDSTLCQCLVSAGQHLSHDTPPSVYISKTITCDSIWTWRLDLTLTWNMWNMSADKLNWIYMVYVILTHQIHYPSTSVSCASVALRRRLGLCRLLMYVRRAARTEKERKWLVAAGR